MLEERPELPIPDSEVTRSSSAAKIASLFDIRDFACLLNRNMVFSCSDVVKYNTTTAECKLLFAGMARSNGVAAQPGQG